MYYYLQLLLLKIFRTRLSKFCCVLLFWMLLFSVQLNAQLVSAYYTWSKSSQTYVPGTSALVTPANIFSEGWDDAANATAYKFPFDFTYKGTLYTGGVSAIGVDTDGWVAFSTSGSITMTGSGSGGSWVSITNSTGVYLNGSANDLGFCGFNSDLQDQTFATFTGNISNGSATVTNISDFNNIRVGTRLTAITGITSGTVVNSINVPAATITLSTTATATTTGATLTPRSSIYAFIRGVAPYRQFVIQWTRATRYNAPGDDFSFQLVLNEGGLDPLYQTLQTVYGICKATNLTPQNAQAGLRGASSADFNARTTTTDWATTTASVANTDVCTLTPSVFPLSGLTYTWSPACAAIPSNPGAISGPANVCPNTTFDYSIPGVPGATFYTWTYTVGSGVTLSGTTTLPTNSLIFGPAATAGTLTVTPGNLCGNSLASSSISISISAAPTATISYSPSSLCTNAGPVTPTITPATVGTFTASPGGLSINASTGQITPATSTPGNYVVTFTFTSGCTATTTANVSINAVPSVTPTANPSSVCSATNSLALQASVGASGNYIVSSIPYASLTPSGSPTILWNTYQLDNISSAIPMPFAFSFYGSAITNFFVLTEGYIQLQTGTAVEWTPQALPNTVNPNNIVALAWADLIVDPSTNPGSRVRYFTNGVSPNQVLVIEYTNLRFLVGSGSQNVTGQIRLYQSDNHIEVAAGSINDNGASWSKTLGIENATGTIGVTPSGRNNVVWNTSSEAWAFYPVSNLTYSWSPSTFLNNTAIAAPTATNVNTTTNYTVTVTNTTTGCSGTGSVSVIYGTGLSGTYTVGPGGNYTTLTAAVNAYNTQCIGGPIIFSILSAYTSAGETFPIVINKNAFASAVNTLTIKPASGATPTITGSVSSAALIKVLGNYVTIDGSNTTGGTTRNLTIINTNNSNAFVIHLGSTGTSPIVYTTIKNCTIRNGISSSSSGDAIALADGSSLLNTGYFNNINIENNRVQKSYFGISVYGTPVAGNGTGITIQSNLMNTSGSNALSDVGIYLEGVDGVSITSNDIGNFESTEDEVDYGIWINSGTVNCTIEKNTIHDIMYTVGNGYAGQGIVVSTDLIASNVTIKNNMLYNFTGDGDDYEFFGAIFCPAGIYLYGDQRGVNIYNNTIYLSGNTINTDLAASFGIALDDDSRATIKNNMILNSNGRVGTIGFGCVGIAAYNSNAQFTAISNNNYYCNGTGTKAIGRIANTSQTTLAGWQTASGGEAGSTNILPVFLSATNLHMNTGSNNSLSNTGTVITGITSDYDDETRNGTNPDVGADEWVKPNNGSWVGKTNTDWLVPTNWEANFIPDRGTDVTITGGYTFMPTLSTTQAVRNIAFSAPAPANTPLLTISGGTLQVYGNITRTAGTINGRNGTLEMDSSNLKSIPSKLFVSDNLKNLVINNTEATTGVTLLDTLNILGAVSFGSSSSRKLTTNGFLTLKSSDTATASLGKMAGTNSIVGDVRVERYIPVHSKAWQFLSTPITATSSQTVKQAWQDTATLANQNRYSGYGTQLTSPRVNANTQPSPGFDTITIAGPSIKVYNRITGGYTALNRTDTAISNPKGYMVFVRGDRSATTLASPVTATTMRTKGTLHTPANPPVTMSLATTGFESVGNPYASAIDFRLLNFTGGVQQTVFYVWDPQLTTGGSSPWGLGGFRTVTLGSPGVYSITPNTGVFATKFRGFIESGQAFFVNAPLAAGSVGFSEACKVDSSSNVNRVSNAVTKQLLTNLNVITANENILLDGNRIQYDQGWSNKVDINDAIKLNNTGENLGIFNAGKILSVERRKPLDKNDTIFYRIGQCKVQQYQFEFIPENLNETGLEGLLMDKYLGTSSAVGLSDTSRIAFNIINDPGSYATDRFYMVFRKKKKHQQLPLATGGSLEQTADTKIKHAAGEKIKAYISVYPNPVENKIVQIQFVRQASGIYKVQLSNKLGQSVFEESIQLSGTNTTKQLQLQKDITPGSYQLAIIAADGTKTTSQVIIK